MCDALREVENGVMIRLWVIPKANKTGIDGYDNWKRSFRFKTKEPPLDDRANRSTVDFFSSLFGKRTVLSSGRQSRQKEILVFGATLSETSSALKEK